MIKKISYSQAGVNYHQLDFVKKFAQKEGVDSKKNLFFHGFSEISDTRGESAYVWKRGKILMASVIEGLGTKNLVADETSKITGKDYYDIIGHDTVAAIINDLITVGATPLVIHAYWAVGDNKFFVNKERVKNLIKGWLSACNLAKVVWAGGETPCLKNIINSKTIDLAGSAIGFIKEKKFLIYEKKLKPGDKIILIKSSGINVNGLTLARAVAKSLFKGYGTKLPSGKIFGEALLNKTNIYAQLIKDLQENNIDIHYITNITGHGLRKVMRAKKNYTYVLEKVFEPQEIFLFIQKYTNLSDKEMYETFNMGMDYALFISDKDVEKTQKLILKNGFKSIIAGYVEKGKKQVIIKPKKIILKGNTLNIR